MRQDAEAMMMLSASTGEGGAFHFDNVEPGRYQVLARARRWFGIRSGVEVDAASATEDVGLELQEGGTLRLRHACADADRGRTTRPARFARILQGSSEGGRGGALDGTGPFGK